MQERHIRVLMVEDDAEDALLTRDILSKSVGVRFDVHTAASVQEGLDHLEGESVDIVLLDLTLPDSRGIETFLRFHSRRPDLPVILLTGAADEELSMLAVQEGAQDYLAKGRLDRDQLTRSIRYAIERQRSESALRRYRDHLEELVAARTADLKRANDQLQQEINERKQTQDEMQHLQEELIEARKLDAVGRLAAGVAHEFNNALTVITGYGELLRDRLPEGDPVRTDIEQIVKAGERAATLTRQLLAFGRRQVIRPKVIDVGLLITAAKALIQPQIPEGITVDAVAPTESVAVRVDESQFERVLLNLAANARDAMPNGGTLSIRAENVIVDEVPLGVESESGRFVCVSVEDTGTGMDGETLEHLFEPFYSTKKAGQGVGLGLAVVYGIMRQHGGWTEASSRLGGGTVFRLYLPAAPVQADGVGDESGRPFVRRRDGKGELILLVEDEGPVREFLKRALENAGYVVEDAATAEQALAALARTMDRCQMLLVDVVLPDRNGLDLADEMLAIKPALKVMVSSGYSDGRSHRGRAEASGFYFLAKPYSMADLLNAVHVTLHPD